MKGSRAVVVLFLALVCGLAAMLLGAQWMTSRADPGAAATTIVVAGRDIPIGTEIEAGMLERVAWTSEMKPAGAFGSPAALEGRVVRTALLRGEPVLEARLAPIGTRGGLSAVIAEGKRAITVKVNEVIGVAGFALPGTFVDVMVNAKDDDRNPVSKIVLERILVLAVAQEASQDQTKPKVVSAVTLEVLPEQAEALDLARSIGTLSLVLRNQVDQQPTGTAGVRTSDLLRQEAPPAPAPAPAAVEPPKPRVVVRRAPPPDPRARVEVIRGMQRSSSEL
ncbi:MAG: Flp pilus assembly protein CpaB [Pseudomonadota bacterium]|nr:Flp pilus assembly protein CpaB [Pseudomonadota bacterium]